MSPVEDVAYVKREVEVKGFVDPARGARAKYEHHPERTRAETNHSLIEFVSQ
jgi:hypothetical protein